MPKNDSSRNNRPVENGRMPNLVHTFLVKTKFHLKNLGYVSELHSSVE